MTPEERKTAVLLAGLADKGGWNRAALADVLAAVGLMPGEQAERIAAQLHQDPDPNYESVCPSGSHPAKGNVYRTKDFRVRCTACKTEADRRMRERARSG